MKKLLIVVEGWLDMGFIKDFMTVNFSEKILDSHYELQNVEGYTKLQHNKNSFLINTANGGKNLILFDADSNDNDGGYSKRKEYIEKVISDKNFISDIFLFPNNQDDGDLETLLCSIINPDHEEIFKCWDVYEQCLKSKNPRYTLPARKTKVSAYLEALLGRTKSEKKKIDDARDYKITDHWNLKHQNLDNLKIAIEKCFNELST